MYHFYIQNSPEGSINSNYTWYKIHSTYVMHAILLNVPNKLMQYSGVNIIHFITAPYAHGPIHAGFPGAYHHGAYPGLGYK